MTVKLLSRVRLSATPWTVAHQAPPSMGFSRQEYWSGVPLPSPRRRRGGVKRGEMSLVSNLFPKCSPQPGTPREIDRVK